MTRFASTTLIVLSTVLLGFYALVWLAGTPPHGSDSRSLLVNAIGLAGAVLGGFALRELHRQGKANARLKAENEGFV